MAILTRVESVSNGTLAHSVKVFSADAIFGAVVPNLEPDFFFGAISVHMETPNVISTVSPQGFAAAAL